MASGDSNWDGLLSRQLTGILRHGRNGFKKYIEKNGWLEISMLLQYSHFCRTHCVTYDQIVAVVAKNDKQRFKISEDGLKIKANQGHTIDISDDSLERITLEKAATYSAIVHGTYHKVLKPILRSGLSRMKRNHIHLTASDRVDASIGVISGFRASCEILIYIDICKAVEDGIDFFVSENNVILCSGNENGILEPIYFLKIVDHSTNNVIDILAKSNQSKSTQTKSNQSKATQTETESNLSEVEIRRNDLQKRIKRLMKKLKEIDKLNSRLSDGNLKHEDLEKGQIEKFSKRKEFEESIETLNSELEALYSETCEQLS